MSIDDFSLMLSERLDPTIKNGVNHYFKKYKDLLDARIESCLKDSERQKLYLSELNIITETNKNHGNNNYLDNKKRITFVSKLIKEEIKKTFFKFSDVIHYTRIVTEYPVSLTEINSHFVIRISAGEHSSNFVLPSILLNDVLSPMLNNLKFEFLNNVINLQDKNMSLSEKDNNSISNREEKCTFMLKDLNKLRSTRALHNCVQTLIGFGYIDNKTTDNIFREAFSGESVKSKIIWIGSMPELKYFISKIKSDLIKKSRIWKRATNSFKGEGGEINRETLRTSDNINSVKQKELNEASSFLKSKS